MEVTELEIEVIEIDNQSFGCVGSGSDTASAPPLPAVYGHLARAHCNVQLPLQVCKSNAGFYVGTMGEFGPCSRESNEYFRTEKAAANALQSGSWTQKAFP